jgi:hypothetical protein
LSNRGGVIDLQSVILNGQSSALAAQSEQMTRLQRLEHDQEKWTPVFLKNRAKTNESRAWSVPSEAIMR